MKIKTNLPSPAKLLDSLVTLSPYLIFACVVLVAWPYSMDDAFITFTYSRSLVESGAVSYNGIQVEGYTSFLHMLIAAFLLLLSTPDLLLPLIKFLSLSLGFLMIFLAGRAVLRLGGTRLSSELARMALATSPVLAYHHASALETPLVYVCALWLLLSLLGVKSPPAGRVLHRILLPLFVGMLVRPDFALFVIPTSVYVLGRERFNVKRLLQKAHWPWLLAIFLAGVGYLSWKYLSFGSILPNPYFVKNSVASTGAGFFFDKWQELCVVAPAVPLAGLLLLVSLFRKPIASVAALSATAYTLAFFGTNFWQDHYLRYFSPLIPLATIACYATVSLQNKHNKRQLLFLMSLPIFLANALIWPNYVLYTRGMKPDSRAAIGKALADTLPSDAVICTGDAGAIPFFSGLANIDIYFLNSRLLTQNRIEGPYWGLNTDLVYSLKPDVLILTSVAQDTFASGQGGNRGLSFEMASNPALSQYVRVASVDGSADYLPFRLRNRLANYRPAHSHRYIYQVFFRRESDVLLDDFLDALKTHVKDWRVRIWTFEQSPPAYPEGRADAPSGSAEA